MQYPPPNPDVFNPLVWRIVRQVPHGVVSTYGQIASMIPTPENIDAEVFARLGPQWVGQALNAVSFRDIDGQPMSPGVPWWRIINSKGGISMPEGSSAATEQRRRLVAEDVTFGPTGRVALAVYGWEGPSADWLDETGLLAPKPLRKPGGPPPEQLSMF